MQCPPVLLHLFLYTRFPEAEDFHGFLSQFPKPSGFSQNYCTYIDLEFMQYARENHKTMHSLYLVVLIL
jgi:hypothetical protein